MNMKCKLLAAILLGALGTAAYTAAKPAADRQAEILGKPMRIAPLREDEIAPEMRALVAPPKGYGNPGELPEQFRVMLRNPELLKAYTPMGGYFIVQGKLPPRDRELMILRNGWLCQAPYEWGEHVAIAKRNGVTSAEIERVTRGPEAPGWSEHDRALLRAVDELHANSMISDATWNTLAKTLSDVQMLEVPMLIGQYQAGAYVHNSLRLNLRPGNPGLSAR